MTREAKWIAFLLFLTVAPIALSGIIPTAADEVEAYHPEQSALPK